MPLQVKNKTVYTAVNVSEEPEARGFALKILRKFADAQGAPDDFDFGDLVDKIVADEAWIVQHPEGNVTFVTKEQYERDFEQA